MPVPLTTRDGHAARLVHDDRVPELRPVTVLRWVPGRFRPHALGPSSAAQIGRVLAVLHAHARQHRIDPQRVRPVLDADGLVGPQAVMGPVEALPGLPSSSLALIDAARERIHADLDPLFEDEEDVGLIHADLHGGNVVFHEQGASPIDFDDCAHSVRHLDLAVTLSFLRGSNDSFPATRDALLDAYGETYLLTDQDLRTLETLCVAQRIAGLGWLVSRSDVPRIRAHVPKAHERVVALLRRFLDGEALLFADR